MSRQWMCLALLLSLPAVASAQSPLTYSSTVVFGDSFADIGNSYNTLGPIYDPVNDDYEDQFAVLNYTPGRFTNGFGTVPAAQLYIGLWHEQLTKLLPGVPPALPYVTTFGTNYAWIGATTQGGTSTVNFSSSSIPVHNMGRQVLDYLNSGAVPSATTLYIVMGGATDLVADSSPDSVSATASQVTALVQQLVDAGAVNVLVPNLPPLSSNPNSPIALASASYRTQLAADLAALQAQYATKATPFHLTQLDLFALYNNIAANPAAFGFTNVSTPAQSLATTQPGGDPDTYWSWDATNPTTGGHHAIAEAACTALTKTTTTLTLDSATATPSTPSTLTATVSTAGTYGVPSTATPTGSVAFYSDSYVLTTYTHTLLGTAPIDAKGAAKLTVTTLSPGSYTISAIYSGDSNFPPGCLTPEISLVITQTFPGFLVVTPLNLYTGLAEGVSTTATATPVGAFTGNVTFSCGPLPQYISCTWQNPTVPVGASGTTYYASLFIATAVTSSAAAHQPTFWSRTAPIALAALLLLPLSGTLRRRRLPALLLFCLVLGALTAATGCGAAGSGGAAPPKSPTGPVITAYAPPGQYTIPIIATSNGVTITTNINLYIADGD
jgi:phospholipase/lecithinase/hemolysin